METAPVTLDLSTLAPAGPVEAFDLVPFLHMEFVLKEDLFRTRVDEIDWSLFKSKTLAVFCSNDALVPSWAYMLLVSEAARHGIAAMAGHPEQVYERLFLNALERFDWRPFEGRRVLVKGCSNKEVPVSVFAEAASRLTVVARRVMYGEACSFVPVYKGARDAVPAGGAA